MDTRDTTVALPYSYAPLPAADGDVAAVGHKRWRPLCATLVLISAAVLLLVVVGLAGRPTGVLLENAASSTVPASEKATGVRSKSGGLHAGEDSFSWSESMLRWQRTGFHYQPEKNYMSDPCGPLHYKGLYHLFYQYNPDGAVWGHITWGHAVSRDLLHWSYLPIAIVPDQWYDIQGVWSGSATLLPDGSIAMLYTGSTNASVQVQCLVVPADRNDPLLTTWTKYEGNPVLYPPADIATKDFRDLTTAWHYPADDTWRLFLGSKDAHRSGVAVTYKTKDFISYERLPGVVHHVPNTGEWECVDLFPVDVNGTRGIDMTDAVASNEEVVHVLKASMDDERHDYYAFGRYDAAANRWTSANPDPDMEVGYGLRYDTGKFYASRSFYDPAKRRRVLWAYVGETDSPRDDIAKGWASVQSIPRTVTFDTKTRTNLLSWPVEELELLRANSTDYSGITVDSGSLSPLNVQRGDQVDILAEFQLDPLDLAAATEADVGYNCSTSGGSTGRGALGPFGLLVLADAQHRTEQTAVYFYVARGLDGHLTTYFCQDETQSSRSNDITKRVIGSVVPVLDGETLSVRILVDHSIVESFAQGGRAAATSRVYPTKAIYDNAGVYVFNNATSLRVTAKSLVIHEMESSNNQAYKA